MRIAFFGSDAIAMPCLHAIQENSAWEICAVLTQPDRKSGRGRKMQPNPIKQWAIEQGIPTRDPEQPTDSEVEWLGEVGADLTLVMAYGHILKENLLGATPRGCFNLHASLLPNYRGASPIETALAMGEVATGVTLMRIIPRMDAGPILDAERVLISLGDTRTSLRQKVSQSCVPLIERFMSNLTSQNLSEIIQDESKATYCRKLSKTDGRMDFKLSAEEIEARSRAFEGWPGCYFMHQDVFLKVQGLQVHDGFQSLSEGERYKEETKGLIIGTGKGAIEVLKLQKPGGEMMEAADFLRGYPMPEEITFSSIESHEPLLR